jgi:pimeloyl-ACP methyl ester carboxylesterase
MLGLDDRGHGQTKAPADPRRLKNWDVFGADLEAYLEHLGKPVIAMGHSRGGVVSLMLAARRPDLIKALVLVDPTVLPLSWMWWWFLMKSVGLGHRIPIAARAAKRRFRWPDRRTLLESYRGKAVFRAWEDGFLEAYVREGIRENGRGQVELACHPRWESRCFAVCPHDVWKTIPRLKQPTLVVYGRSSDTFLPAAARRFQKVLPRARLIGLAGTGHFVPMEKPDETVAAVFDFLSDQDLL